MKRSLGNHSHLNRLRIIGGKWRGRKLDFPDLEELRPTSDRIRETVFNWLAPVLPGARCLDLFAGSGALGLEALSRGAAEVVMVERQAEAARRLRSHCQILGAASAMVIETDALAWLDHVGPAEPFHIVFLDPPFRAQLHQRVAAALEASGILAPDAHVYLECERGQVVAVPSSWEARRHKQAGNVSYGLYRRP